MTTSSYNKPQLLSDRALCGRMLHCVNWLICVGEQGTFFRLYYPGQEMENAQKPDWIPCKEYFNGLADFMKINRSLSERIFNYLFGESFFSFLFIFILFYFTYFIHK